MIIKSNEVEVNASQETVFNLLNKVSNLHFLLPKDKISDWKSDDESCSFKVQNGVVTISLVQDGCEGIGKIKGVAENGFLILESVERSKVFYDLKEVSFI